LRSINEKYTRIQPIIKLHFLHVLSIFLALMMLLYTWRGAGAVELATLERWYTGNGIVGSNPTLSANNLPTHSIRRRANRTRFKTDNNESDHEIDATTSASIISH
jgi:hypothetical protein